MKREDSNSKKDDPFIFGIKLSRKDKAKWLAHFKREAKTAKALYKGEARSVESLDAMFEETGKNVCQCGGTKFSRKYGKRKAKCLSCKRVASITARMPFFHGVNLLDIHLCMLHLIDAGCIFNAHQFSIEMKVSYDTAWNLMRKVELAMLIAQRSDENCLSIDSRLIIELFTRRSVATPAFKEPSAEQQAMEDLHTSSKKQEQEKEKAPGADRQQGQEQEAAEANGNEANQSKESLAEEDEEKGDETGGSPQEGAQTTSEMKLLKPENAIESRQPGAGIVTDLVSDPENSPSGLTEFQKKVYEANSGEPRTFDSLVSQLDANANELNAALTMLELESLIIRLPGNRYVRANITPPASIQPAQNTYDERMIEQINAFMNIIQINNQGVSRKYANLHLANVNRLYKQSFDPKSFSIFQICSQFNDVGRTEVKNFISGLTVEIVMPMAA